MEGTPWQSQGRGVVTCDGKTVAETRADLAPLLAEAPTMQAHLIGVLEGWSHLDRIYATLERTGAAWAPELPERPQFKSKAHEHLATVTRGLNGAWSELALWDEATYNKQPGYWKESKPRALPEWKREAIARHWRRASAELTKMRAVLDFEL